MTGVNERVQMLQLALGYVMAQAVYVAAKLGIADLLATGPRHIDELATAMGVHGRSLYRFLRALCGAGVFVEDDEHRFALTPLGETLRSGVPGSVRAAVIWIGEPPYYRSCGELMKSVMTGRPVIQDIFGKPYFDYVDAQPEAGRIFNEGMACFSDLENEAIAKSYAFTPDSRVVDVAGGHGGFLAEILKANPSVRGILYDLPDVVKDSHLLEDAGVKSRCDTVAGNFFESLPPGADVYVFKRVLHDWDDDTCVSLLRRCRTAMSAIGRVLVVDAVIAPGNDAHGAKVVDLIMLTSFTGAERTEAEFRRLFEGAGLRLTRVVPTPSMLSIVEAVAA